MGQTTAKVTPGNQLERNLCMFEDLFMSAA